MIFLALTCLQLGVAVGLRPVQLTRQNPLLPLAVAGSFLLALAGVYVPVLQDLLGTTALPAGRPRPRRRGRSPRLARRQSHPLLTSGTSRPGS